MPQSKPLIVFLEKSLDEDSSVVIQALSDIAVETKNSYGIEYHLIKYIDLKSSNKKNELSKKLKKSVHNVIEQKSPAARGLTKLLHTTELIIQQSHEFADKFRVAVNDIASKPREETRTEELLGHGRVVLLVDFPSNAAELRELVNNSSTNAYPLLDGVVKFVCKGSGAVKSSVNGTNSTRYDPEESNFRIPGKTEFDILHEIRKGTASEGRLWHDLTYDEYDVMRPHETTGKLILKDLSIIYEEFSKLINILSHQKYLFRSWSNRSVTIDIPVNTGIIETALQAQNQANQRNFNQIWVTNPLYSSYIQNIDKLLPSFQTVGGILNEILQTLSTETSSSDDNSKQLQRPKSSPHDVMSPSPSSSYSPVSRKLSFELMEGKQQRKKMFGKQNNNHQLSHDEFMTPSHTSNKQELAAVTFEENDFLSLRTENYILSAKNIENEMLAAVTSELELEDVHSHLRQLIHLERQSVFRSLPCGLLGHGGFPLRPLLTSSERGIQETELLSFSSLSPSDLHRFHQIKIYDVMTNRFQGNIANFTGTLRTTDGVEWSILKRRYFREISPTTLQQILVSERVKDPLVVRYYDSSVDELLLALFWPPPSRRMKTVTWTPRSCYRTRASFEEFLVATQAKNFPLRTLHTLNSFTNVTDELLARYKQIINTITPADKSIIKLIEMPTVGSCWLSIHSGDSTIGLRHYPPVKVSSTVLSPLSPSLPGNTQSPFKKQQQAQIPPWASQDTPLGCFIWQVREDVRITAAVKASGTSHLKPDRKTPVYCTVTYPNGLHYTVCSDGVTRIVTPKQTYFSKGVNGNDLREREEPVGLSEGTLEDGLMRETDRILIGNHILRNISTAINNPNYPFSIDLMYSNGSRVLVRNPLYVKPKEDDISYDEDLASHDGQSFVYKKTFSSRNNNNNNTNNNKDSSPPHSTFLESLLEEIPDSWKYISLEYSGEVICYSEVADEAPQPHLEEGEVEAEEEDLKNLAVTSRSTDSLKNRSGAARKDKDNHSHHAGHSHAAQTTTPIPATPTAAPAIVLKSKRSSSESSSFSIQAKKIVSSILYHDVSKCTIDAVTLAEIREFPDGRVLEMYPDNYIRAYFPEGTTIATSLPPQSVTTRNPKRSYPSLFGDYTVRRDSDTIFDIKGDRNVLKAGLVMVTKKGFPSIEIDLEIDTVSSEHAKGVTVPISKGGERVRSRVVSPDGMILVVKYDTRVTASNNGSIKVVRRDRTAMLAKDGGEILFSPQASWTQNDEIAFAKDLVGDAIPALSEPSPNRHKRKDSRFAVMESIVLPGGRLPSGGAAASYERHVHITTMDDAGKADGHKNDKNIQGDVISKLKNKKEKEESLNKSYTDTNTMDTTSSKIMSRSGKGSLKKSKRPKDEVLKQKSVVVEHELLPTASVETKYRFSVREGELKCFIEDCEHNRFNLDLLRPSDIEVDLAGEVQGLKAQAISDNPIEPRLFIVRRNMSATEIVRVQDVTDIERSVVLLDELGRTEDATLNQPSDLSVDGKQHTYIYHRRSIFSQSFSFCDVCPTRKWHQRTPSAALTRALYRSQPNNPHLKWLLDGPVTSESAYSVSTNVYQALAISELRPLSDAGYQDLDKAMKKWLKWREQRVISINRFVVEDPRTDEEISQEAEIRKRLKKAYSRAKKSTIQVTRKHSKVNGKDSTGPGGSNMMVIGGRGGMAAAVMEGLEEGSVEIEAEQDMHREFDNQVPDFGDEHSEAEFDDPEEHEIKAAFDTYKISSKDGWDRLPARDIRAALVQVSNRVVSTRESVYNKYISQNTVDELLAEEFYEGIEGVTLDGFRMIYFRMKQNEYFNGNDEEESSSSLSKFPAGSYISKGAYSSITGSNVDDNYHEANKNKPAAATAESPPLESKIQTAVTERTFWNTRLGKVLAETIPESMPPLHERPLNWKRSITEGEDEDAGEFNHDNGGSSFLDSSNSGSAGAVVGAVGAGINAVRNPFFSFSSKKS